MASDASSSAFKFSLNTSTIMGQKVPIAEEVKIAAEAGYQAIEPWIRELDAHVEAGHSLDDLCAHLYAELDRRHTSHWADQYRQGLRPGPDHFLTVRDH